MFLRLVDTPQSSSMGRRPSSAAKRNQKYLPARTWLRMGCCWLPMAGDRWFVSALCRGALEGTQRHMPKEDLGQQGSLLPALAPEHTGTLMSSLAHPSLSGSMGPGFGRMGKLQGKLHHFQASVIARQFGPNIPL